MTDTTYRRIPRVETVAAATAGRGRRTVNSAEPSRLPDQGAAMADKSPRQHMSKKAGKSLKEKRAEKHAKAEAQSKIEIIPHGKKH